MTPDNKAFEAAIAAFNERFVEAVVKEIEDSFLGKGPATGGLDCFKADRGEKPS